MKTYHFMSQPPNVNKGFSLIELLVVLSITGILCAIIYPGYRDTITRTHRSDGQTALLDLAIRMENYYTKNNTYKTATIGQGTSTDVLVHATSPEGFYLLSLSKLTHSTYTLKATPTPSQANADSRCQSLTFNSLGIKGITTGPAGNPTAPASTCWS